MLFQGEMFLLGYGVIYHLGPFLLQSDIHPEYERLIDLCEEVLDIDRYHLCLQEELEAMSDTSSEAELERELQTEVIFWNFPDRKKTVQNTSFVFFLGGRDGLKFFKH